MLPDIQKKLLQAFPDAIIDLQDMYGDGQHLKLFIEDVSFSGKSRLSMHRMVYEALDGIVGDKLHALTIQARGRPA